MTDRQHLSVCQEVYLQRYILIISEVKVLHTIVLMWCLFKNLSFNDIIMHGVNFSNHYEMHKLTFKINMALYHRVQRY